MNRYKNIKIITCASFGGTGSSVVTDLMKEFSNIKSLGDYEFAFAHDVDGISDLQHYIVDDFHRHKVDEGIYRFKKKIEILNKSYKKYFNDDFYNISNEYINNLITYTWNGHWKQHAYRHSNVKRKIKYVYPAILKRKINKYIGKKTSYEYVPKFPRMPMNISCVEDDFFEITRDYTSKLISTLDKENRYEYIALDQLVPPTNINRYINYFENLKVIVVDRDPRDLYILNKFYWNEGWIPSHDVELYVNWFRSIRKPIKNENELVENILRVRFEDFIFKYDETINKIIKFLEISSENHIYKFDNFNPKKSIKNCRLWEKVDIDIKDIQYIEKELEEFCYKL